MIKYGLLFVLATIIGFVSFLFYYLGAFKDVAISEVDQPAQKIIYVDNLGPYHKIAKVLAVIEDAMKKINAPCGRTFGEYLDDPESVEPGRLRSRLGCIVETVPVNLDPDLKVGELAATHYVKAVFTGSPGIGPIKVYPKVNEYMKANGLKQSGAVIEVYEIHSITENNAMTTTYLFPASK